MFMLCPLCYGHSAHFAFERGRRYHRCSTCGSVFMDPDDRPSIEEERRRYLLHDNDPQDPGYRSFVTPLVEAVTEMYGPGSKGLDHGSGGGSAVAAMLRERGHDVRTFDPVFDPQEPDGIFDYIVCCEVIEHFRDPVGEFRRIRQLLKGHLFIMTDPYDEGMDFSRWYYKDDETHFFLYSRKALGMVPGLEPVRGSGRVFVLRSSR